VRFLSSALLPCALLPGILPVHEPKTPGILPSTLNRLRRAGRRRGRLLPALVILPALVLPLLVAGCSGGAASQDTAAPPSPPESSAEVAEGAPASPERRAIQPSAPGEPTRVLSAADLAGAPHPEHTQDDVRFMQGMLHHHAQAMVMTELATRRTTSQDIRLLARRIELSQNDEITLMRRWLETRGEEVPELVLRFGADGPDDHAGHDDHAHHPGHAGHAGHGAHGDPSGHDSLPMHGMLSNEELARLAAASNREFDLLFLEFMIRHHLGAVQMVADLVASPGSGQEEEISQFASHVEADQNIEIRRMRGMLNARR